MSTRDQQRVTRARRLLFWGTALLGILLLPFGMAAEEDWGLWLLFRSRGAVAPPNDVVVIGIDETSERALDGPVTRTQHARLVDALSRAGAAVIVFDVFLHRAAEGDAELADAMGRVRNTVVTARVERNTVAGMDTQELRAPIPELATRAIGVAPWLVPAVFRVNWVFPYDDSDRATIPLLVLQAKLFDEFMTLLRLVRPDVGARFPQTRGSLTPDRPLERVMAELHETFTSDSALAPEMLANLAAGQPGLRTLVLSYARPTGRNRLVLNYYGPPRTVLTVPYQDALAGRAAPETFAGKVVFIGYSAQRQPGQQDDYPYVYSTAGFNLSGVEMGATAFANLLHGDSLRLPALYWRIALVALWGLAIAAAFGRFQLWTGMALASVLSVAYIAAAVALFGGAALWLPIVVPGVQLLFAGTLSLRVRQLTERAQLVVGTSEEAALALTGRGKPEKIDHRVVMFADEQGSKKRLLRALEELDAARRLSLQRDFAVARDVPVAANGGQINHAIADSMLAHWVTRGPGDEVDLSKNARAACRAALAIHARVAALDGRYPGHAPQLRIGLDWGEIVSRLNPSPEIKDWRMEGTPIHTAERLESLNKVFGTATLVSHAVASRLDEREFHCHELGTFVFCDDTGAVVVDAVRVYELRASEAVARADADQAARFGAALAVLQARDWSAAAAQFAELGGVGRKHAELASRYASWCRQTLDETGARWRGRVKVSFSDKSQYLDRFTA